MKKMITLLMFALSATACIEGLPLPADDQQDAGSPDDSPDVELTLTLTATPKTITVGGSSTLDWYSKGGTDYCYFQGSDAQHLETEGSKVVSPIITTAYDMVCSTDDNHAVLTRVIVTVIQPAPTLNLTALPTTIMSGDSSTVSWVSSNTTSCSSTGGAQPTNGSWVVSPTTTTTYTINCTGPGGNVSDSVTVTVIASAPMPTLNFSATAWTITSGQSSVLSWTTTNADTCVISGGQFGGGVTYASNWNVTVSPTTSTNYWLVCTGPGGTVSSSGTLIVSASTPTVCHGLYVTFTSAAKENIHHCSGWSATGTESSLSVSLQVNGGEGVCAITCPKKVGEGNVLPSTVSGIWLPGATADVPRWYTYGCKRLPDHPASEPDQAGGTWDQRCDLY